MFPRRIRRSSTHRLPGPEEGRESRYRRREPSLPSGENLESADRVLKFGLAMRQPAFVRTNHNLRREQRRESAQSVLRQAVLFFAFSTLYSSRGSRTGLSFESS